MTESPAGWYPDPQDRGQLRWWDGSSWTEHRHPAIASPVTATEAKSLGDHETTRAEITQVTPTGSVRSRSSAENTPWFKRPWAIALLSVLVVVGLATAAFSLAGTDESDPAAAASSPTTDPSAEAEAQAAEDEALKEAQEEAERQAEAEEAAAAEKLNPKSYKTISPRKFARVVKNPDAHVGERYVIYGYVTQFDSATGLDSFLASTGAREKTESNYYDLDVNTLASTDDPARFEKVVEDDLVKMFVEVGGSYSYDTQIGGNTTVPLVLVNIIKVTGSVS